MSANLGRVQAFDDSMPAQAERLDIMRKVFGKSAAVTVREMIDALKDLTLSDGYDTTYVIINSDSVKLVLIEETLTDGSKVYNIELSEACK
jgi:hypothetical protein